MKKLLVIFFVVLAILGSSWVLLKPGFFRVHDYIHAARIAEMTRALEEGQVPPRWTRNFGYGYGMPLFEFYGPLPYFVGAIFYWLGLPIIPSIKMIFLLSSIGTAIGSYKLGKSLFGRAGGVVTAVAITLAPYRAVNLFVRGAVSEAWGIMAMPWVLYGTIEVIKGKKRGWLTVVISLAVLMLSHNIMTMLFVPFGVLFAVLYAGIHYLDSRNWKQEFLALCKIAGSYILAIGLALFYMVPAVAEKDYTQVAAIFNGYFYYANHFLYIRQFFVVNWGYTGSAWGPNDGISFFLGLGQLVGAVLVMGLVVWWVIGQLRQKQSVSKIVGNKTLLVIASIVLLLCCSLFMSLLRAKPIWDALQPLQFAQFPWRFMGPGVVFLGLLVGSGAVLIKSTKLRLVWMVGCIALLLVNAQYFHPETFLDDPANFYYTDPDRIQRLMSSILPDYIPKTLAKDIPQPKSRVTCGEFTQSLQDTCGDKVTLVVDRGHEVLVKTSFSQSRMINFAIADFPGWGVEVDGKPAQKEVTKLGTVSVNVPAGEHFVGARLNETPVRLWSDIVSVVSILILLGLIIPVPHHKLKRVLA